MCGACVDGALGNERKPLNADTGLSELPSVARRVRRPLHWMVRLNWRNRSIFFSLLALVFGIHLEQVHAGWPMWVFTLGLMLVLPQVIYAWSARLQEKERQRRAEIWFMRLEALLFVLWCAALGFPLLPSFILFAAMCLNLVVFEGLAGLRSLSVAVLGGLLVALLLFSPLHWTPQTSLPVSLLCVAVFSGFLVTFAHSGHERAVQLYLSHRRAEHQLAEIRVLEAQLREAALRDPLTGLYNRRHLSEILPGALARCARLKTALTLVMIDVDHFKQINDTHGHPAGDAMLRALAQLLQAHVRQGDTVCRMGGEEFLLVLENAPLQPAWERAQVLRASFAGLVVPHEGQALHATVSCGLAAFPEHGDNAQSLLQAADRALYAAKASGRNQLQAAQPAI